MRQFLFRWPYRSCWGLLLISLLVFACTAPERMDRAEKLALARNHLRAERYYSALSLLRDIPPTEEHLVELSLMQALAYFKLADYLSATIALERANPQSPGLQIVLAYFHLLGGNLERSKVLAERLASLNGSSPDLALLMGHINLQAHRYLEAERHFQAVLTVDQMAAKAYIGLGHTAVLQRRLGKAEEYYLRAVFLSGDEISPQLALVNFYATTQRYDDAEETLKLAIERHPDAITLQISLVNLYIKTHKSREAVALLEAVLDKMPFSDYIKVLATRQYFALQRLDISYKLINDILTKDVGNYYGLLLYGEYPFRKGDLELSLMYFHKALSKNINSHIANYYIGVIHFLSNNVNLSINFLEKANISNSLFYNTYLLLGAIYLQSKKYILASEYADSVLKFFPGNINAHLLNGIALYLGGHFDQARYEFNVVEVLEPQNPSAKILRALIELEQHHPRESEVYVAALASFVAERLFLQSQLLPEHGIEPHSLQQQLERSLDAHQAPVAWLILGHIYMARADYARAEVAYKQAMVVYGANVLPYYAMAQLDVVRGNRRQAISYLEQAIAINPAFTKSYWALGSLYEQEKDYPSARATYERGLQYAPDDPALLNNLAWMHLMPGGDVSTAYMHIRKAVSLAPEDPDLQDTLAWWYYLMHDYRQAINTLTRIVKVQPEKAPYHYHLGMAYLKNGDSERARQHLQQALQLGTDDEHRRLIEEHMP